MEEIYRSIKTTSYVFGLNAVMIPPKVFAQKPNSLNGKLVLFDKCILLTQPLKLIYSFVFLSSEIVFFDRCLRLTQSTCNTPLIF